MEKKEIIKITFEKPVKVVSYKEDEGLLFSNGLKVNDYHPQDCCESVYADWKQLEDTGIEDKEFKELVITGNPELGIIINGEFAVPCYNQQNGYYSDELLLNIENIDISNFVKDDIY